MTEPIDYAGEALKHAGRKKKQETAQAQLQAVNKEDLFAVMEQGSYIFPVTGGAYSSAMIDKRFGKKTSNWICINQPVEQVTWAPGEPTFIKDKLIREGGWIARPGAKVLNIYRAPDHGAGDPASAGPWLNHARKVFPEDWEHIIAWFAQRVQFPHIKINHALVIGGAMGVGKDVLIEPLAYAVGTWNFKSERPMTILSAFNGYAKSVVLRVNEARDLGTSDRFKFYDHMKTLIAAPPDTTEVNEKHMKPYQIPNVVGIIITTNYKTDGIHLPADDRRHYVAWSPLVKEDYGSDEEHIAYFNELCGWYDSGGLNHIAAYLRTFDIEGFNPKAPPLKTRAFWDIANANRAPEEAELADVIDRLGNPDATVLSELKRAAQGNIQKGEMPLGDLINWMNDVRNMRTLKHRLERCGYVPLNNPDRQSDHLWKVKGARTVIYTKSDLSVHDQIIAAKQLINSFEDR
jgi:hypothetical protein